MGKNICEWSISEAELVFDVDFVISIQVNGNHLRVLLEGGNECGLYFPDGESAKSAYDKLVAQWKGEVK